ncbi:hypothetical protein WJX72_004439 [[Myrmecia] bisecta]|uniref:Paladin n=1 Tax=[Myrmecia] bisecta TaxID=41462 RepID=A0AAW1PJS3_9CHLO
MVFKLRLCHCSDETEVVEPQRVVQADTPPQPSPPPAQPGNPSGNPTDPAVVVANRKGDVLIKHTILKSDHFPGCQNKKLIPLLDGAPNFRKVPGLPVYGVAIPTVVGLRLVLETLGAEQGRRKVLWHNMREEPVLYINGKPYVVRESSKPFANLEYTGIDKTRVEDMEMRLKQDVLKEAAEYGNQIMVAHENDDFQVIEEWEAVTEVDVQTPLEVYRELAEDGYDVDYLRVPVTDEKAPKERDFALLQRRLWQLPEGAALVFNCQMGRGRTTTGMVIASLLHLRQRVTSLTLPSKAQDGLPDWFVERPALVSPRGGEASREAELRSGKYGVIRSLLRALEGGATSKALLDSVIDACNAMQNLREAIAGYRVRLTHESNEDKRNALLQVCLEYLERYFYLIAYTAYLFDPSFNPQRPQQVSFGQWMKQRPELMSVLQRMLRRNPLAALALHRPSRPPQAAHQPRAQGQPPLVPDGAVKPAGASDDDDEDGQAEDETAVLIANRNGAVLGAHTILKEDHFPGCQSSKLANIVPGAPNFRGVPGQNVYGSGLPTVNGIRAALVHVGCVPSTSEPDAQQATALWYNMREEPVVYINGRPFVLREDERPFKNMQEYTGIDTARLEQMEARLKADVLAEAASLEGKLLVARELSTKADGQEAGSLVDNFEPVQGPDSVQTPREVYEALQRNGYHVQYYRVPMTDGTAPRESTFDVFYEHIKQAGPRDPIIFNCQMGAGRTTTGMVIACLVRMFTSGNGKWHDHEDMNAHVPCGFSPRSTISDDVGGDSPRGSSDDEAGPSLRWQESGVPGVDDVDQSSRDSSMVEADTMEAASLKEGEYVAVRRFTRILERGDDAKSSLDMVIDKCGALVNLRTAIMRYRKPRRWFRFFRPEINVRHTAFKRGSAYLERYCLLIAFTAFLERSLQLGTTMTFREWMAARPDVGQARDAINQNPAGALAPVPVGALPQLWGMAERTNSRELGAEEQKKVLGKRRGSTLSRRSILKSYQPQSSAKHNAMQVAGVLDIRKAKGLPVYTLGSSTVQGVRNLLSALGARPGGFTHVVVTDLREELVAYVNGSPYLRRELEMPSAALHHAGIPSAKLEDMERRLRNDMMHEAVAWNGRVLLHREVPVPDSPAGSPAAGGMGVKGMRRSSDGEDVTRKEDVKPDAAVAAFWEPTGDMGDIDRGLSTPLEVYQGLAAEGYQLTYRRVPLSRERTPEAADLDVLHHQLLMQPEGKHVAHLIVSRTATGSSARFAAAFACMFLRLNMSNTMANASSGMLAEMAASEVAGSPKRLRNGSNNDFTSLAERMSLEPLPEHAPVSAALMGEYRNIMNLCRVLPNGIEAKRAVDEAIDRCCAIGNLREDIHRCKTSSESQVPATAHALQMGQSVTLAARRLGLHYLQRYFFLITFMCFIESSRANLSFARWMADRRELKHLLTTLSLEAPT